MRLTPAQGGDLAAIGFFQIRQSVIESHSCNFCTGFNRGGLHHVTPLSGAYDVSINLFDKQWLNLSEFFMQRSKLILYQPDLQCTYPRSIDQRFWQMLIHFTVPICQKL